MSNRTLSNGTLSLRFMQNANRAKQLKEVQLERAEIQDDGKWEVSQVVKDAWGLKNEPNTTFPDVHVASYLPFLFSEQPSTAADNGQPSSGNKLSGRRVFNKKGEEMAETESHSETLKTPSPPETSASKGKGRKVHPKPVTISARASDKLSGFVDTKPNTSSKSARHTIFESGGVGTDLRAHVKESTMKDLSTSFLKPSGVDEPKSTGLMNPTSKRGGSDPSIKDQKKSKRERVASLVEASQTTKRQKKSKTLAAD